MLPTAEAVIYIQPATVETEAAQIVTIQAPSFLAKEQFTPRTPIILSWGSKGAILFCKENGPFDFPPQYPRPIGGPRLHFSRRLCGIQTKGAPPYV